MGTTEQWIALLLVGFAIGIISGMLGIGGGVLVIPALVFLFHFPHRKAVGTSLAMLLPPIGIFALLKYWHEDHNNVDFKAALLLAAGFAIGGYLGGAIANSRVVAENDRWRIVAYIRALSASALPNRQALARSVRERTELAGGASAAPAELRARKPASRSSRTSLLRVRNS